MGLATLAGQSFRVDPVSIRWDYSVRVADHKAVGGKVVQVLGVNLGDMTVAGTFGTGGWTEQAAFLARMKALGDRQVAEASKIGGQAEPFRFVYPPRGWDFLVYLRAFVQPGAQSSVRLSARDFAPKWMLTLFIVEDNAGLKQVRDAAVTQFIARLAQGLGWRQNQYNGPLTYADIQTAQSGGTPEQYGVASSVPTGQQRAE